MPEMSQTKKTYERRTKTAEQALSALMRYAARAERSSGDAMRLMKGWGVPDGDRPKVLAKLIEHRFIDDRRFAEAYVREKSRLSGWGVHKIRSGLKAKGIPSELIAGAMTQIDEDAAAERLEQILVRRARTIKDADPYSRKAKLVRYGLSRGFGYGEVVEAASKITGAEGDENEEYGLKNDHIL